ncbi:MAGE family-domain-containing protein [Triangularia verruculosa]|uniref:MAGE family-domain-containing protein n=1 Tax=Triangularia verruculosa TaxID=2587418 RepID=A0AAN7AUX3_9PEZI|nr:MAGE family-domain-containing protein [Triangularia verruculosa]
MPRLQQGRRQRPAVDEDEDVDMQEPQEEQDISDGAADETMNAGGPNEELSQLIKKMVRYALACEYSRTPIRRDGIKEKVLGPNGRQFKAVFAGANKQLRAVFGMEMVELPAKDKNLMTTEQKRKAAKSQSQKETTSNAYVLRSILPQELRTPALTHPSKVISADGEAAYTAIYTLIISLITISGGELSDPRLKRHLARLNAAEYMPSMNPNDSANPTEKTEVVLQRMIKHGYLVKTVDNKIGDEDATTWHVGPRGKVEVPLESIAEFVRTIYGGSTPELEAKIQISLKGVKERKPDIKEPDEDDAQRQGGGNEADQEDEEIEEAGPSNGRRRRRG